MRGDTYKLGRRPLQPFMILSKKIVSSWMDLGECPLSKEELLQLVEEEAALRISASFLEQGGQ